MRWLPTSAQKPRLKRIEEGERQPVKQGTYDPGDVVYIASASKEDNWPEYPAMTAGIVVTYYGDELAVQTAWGEVEDLEDSDVQPAIDVDLWVRRATINLRDMLEAKKDDEAAHRWRDAIYIRVLKWTAEGRPQAAVMASQALESETLRFSRWYA